MQTYRIRWSTPHNGWRPTADIFVEAESETQAEARAIIHSDENFGLPADQVHIQEVSEYKG